jgi:hypothetical protein
MNCLVSFFSDLLQLISRMNSPSAMLMQVLQHHDTPPPADSRRHAEVLSYPTPSTLYVSNNGPRDGPSGELQVRTSRVE